MVDIVNVVTSGSLHTEVDLDAIAADFPDFVDYSPEKYPAAYISLSEESPHITLYRTGKYIITGAASEEEAKTFRERLLRLLSEHNILSEPKDEWFSVQNLVCTANTGENLNLSALAVGLGLENTEYEPEQFAGLVYRPSDFDCVLLIMNSGKVIITGTSSVDSARSAFAAFCEDLEALF